MDSRQPATKRRIDENSLQNQDDGINMIEEGGDGTEAKRFKQELHPLLIGAVLETIFTYSDANSIKNARGVNKQWSVEGAKMLINKCHVKIPSDLLSPNVFIMSNEVDAFKTFLSHKSSTMMMIPNITVEDTHEVALWKCLGVLGLHLKSIRLAFIDDEAKLLSQLLDTLPNLSHLSFKDLEYNQNIIKVLTTEMSKAENARSPLVISFMTLNPKLGAQMEDLEKFADCNNIMLTELNVDLSKLSPRIPNLKIRVVNLMEKLLLTSWNTLKTLNFQGVGYQAEIIKILTSLMYDAGKTRKSLIIPQMTLNPKNAEQLKDIDKFADCTNIIIEELEFAIASSFGVVQDRDVANIIRKLLSTSQNIDEILILQDCQLSLSVRNFPSMTLEDTHINLDFITKFQSDLFISKFSPVFRFSTKMPGQPDISITFKIPVLFQEAAYFFSNRFGKNATPSDVNVSVTFDSWCDCDFKPFFKIFPNLKGLKIHAKEIYEPTFNSLWKHGNSMRKLHLKIERTKDFTDIDLNSIFTGFTPSTVKWIKDDLNLAPYSRQELGELRVNPSILNLKELKELEICLPTEGQNSPQTMLAVAKKYAFDYMPNLTLNFD